MLDLVTVTVLALGFIRGYRKGIIVAVFSVVGVLLGILCALKLSHLLAAWMQEKGVNSLWAPMLAYLVMFIGVGWLVRRGGTAIESLSQAVMLGFVNRIAGGLLFAFIGAVVWSSMLWLAAKAGLVSAENAASSVTYDYIQPLAPKVFNGIGVILPFARSLFADLSSLFDQAAQKNTTP